MFWKSLRILPFMETLLLRSIILGCWLLAFFLSLRNLTRFWSARRKEIMPSSFAVRPKNSLNPKYSINLLLKKNLNNKKKNNDQFTHQSNLSHISLHFRIIVLFFNFFYYFDINSLIYWLFNLHKISISIFII